MQELLLPSLDAFLVRVASATLSDTRREYLFTPWLAAAADAFSAGAFGPDLAKKLAQLVKMEKNVMRSMELVGRERMEVAVSGQA